MSVRVYCVRMQSIHMELLLIQPSVLPSLTKGRNYILTVLMVTFSICMMLMQDGYMVTTLKGRLNCVAVVARVLTLNFGKSGNSHLMLFIAIIHYGVSLQDPYY